MGDIGAYLEANPIEARAIIAKARVLEANETTAKLYGTPDVATFMDFNGPDGYTEDEIQASIETIAAFASGVTEFQRETSQLVYDGSTVDTLIVGRIIRSCSRCS